ncbi:MAG: tRNA (N(6)-L-threonylcarbamoyladenosine(37)-C(2))-methylthiotransferase MtaB [Spirochaetes bacterium]|jgi:threonylcarbamoyladenosine tRNA methylthiotransferase MtaB|nr:tRNA (N(6)-L-threonylcarbamoyladenosine(37)-C(2))-methylthiotransferase MtaB [Spirochaetota bacterium]
MKIHIASLGCRLNQAEIQSVITCLKQNGHCIVKPEEAQLFIINSCVVTHTSERKTRTLINSAKRMASSAGHVIITGCFADSYSVDGNVIHLSNDYKHLIPDLIEYNFILPEEMLNSSRFEFIPATGSTRTRINLKIQDGCDNYCSYCIIPSVRGLPVSRSVTDIINEFRTLLTMDYHEFLLTGVMISNYNDNGTDLNDLITRLLSIKGDYRLHLSSLSPQSVTPRLIDTILSDRVVRHLHLSLQSGSGAILKAMNRHYTPDHYLNILEQIRKEDPLYNLTTDLIVGFPGETDLNFDETVQFINSARFSHIHTFRYSQREGTAAAKMQNQIAEEIKKERSKEIMKISSEHNRSYLQKFHGRESTILTEQSKNDRTKGFNNYYVPVTLSGVYDRNQFIEALCSFDEGSTSLEGHPLKRDFS